MVVLARYSARKLLRGLGICVAALALCTVMPWIVAEDLATFLRTSDMSYTWIGVEIWGVGAIAWMTAVLGYRLMRHGGAGIVASESELTVIGLRQRSFERPSIAAVAVASGRFSAITISMIDGSENKMGVSLMDGSAGAIAQAVKETLWTGAKS